MGEKDGVHTQDIYFLLDLIPHVLRLQWKMLIGQPALYLQKKNYVPK